MATEQLVRSPELPAAAEGAGQRRRDIQGLRAVAVGLVVLYHFWPGRLGGGYVGVDVFFVISGFLITGHLAREATRSGRIGLAAFYARRIRRLLPAAILVLAATAIASAVLLPSTQLVNTLREIAGSASYVVNWMLAGDAVDYLGQDAAATPVQHYWSLSVEEQFYLVWPLVLLVPLVLLRARRAALAVTLLVVGALSLLISITWTAADPAAAYFATPTRIWEFVAGAAIALLPVTRAPEVVRGIAALLGLTAIAGSALMFDGATPFPGAAALVPVLGAAAVLWGGTAASRRWMPGRWLSVRPATFVGDISYAVYLWHWPVVVLAPLVVGRPLQTVEIGVALVGILLVSWASTEFLEMPIRRSGFLRGRKAPVALVVVSVVAFWTVALSASGVVQQRVAAAGERADALVGTDCYGAAALIEPTCDPLGDTTRIDPALAVADAENPEYTRCDQRLDRRELVMCTYGPADADTVIALVGDSHATQWLGAFSRIAEDRGWRVDTYLKSSCPLSRAERVLEGEPADRATACRDWQGSVRSALAESTDYDAVVVSAYARGYAWEGDGAARGDEAGISGFAREWTWLADGIAPVVVLADTPLLGGSGAPECIAAHPDDLERCEAPRNEALAPDVLRAAAERLARPDVRLLDMSDAFCTESRCPAVAGSEIVYRDSTHLTWAYARSTVPFLAPRLEALVEG